MFSSFDNRFVTIVEEPKLLKKPTLKSEDIKLLRFMFDRGGINMKSDPSTVYQWSPLFYTNNRLCTFQTRFNTLKRHNRDMNSS